MPDVKQFGRDLYNIEWRVKDAEDVCTEVEESMDRTGVFECTVDDLRNADFEDSEICEILQVMHIHAVVSMV